MRNWDERSKIEEYGTGYYGREVGPKCGVVLSEVREWVEIFSSVAGISEVVEV